jgi:hypothetical protein
MPDGRQTMSTTAQKLQIKNGYAVAFVGLRGAAELVGELPADAHVASDAEHVDAVLLFVANRAELDAALSGVIDTFATAAAVWVCYRKGNVADVNRDVIRERAAEFNWEVVSNVSIDDSWSALRAKRVN